MKTDEKIFVAGDERMIASAILHRLREVGFTRMVTRTVTALDLNDQKMVLRFFVDEKPDYIFLTSSKVGGILANTRYPAEFIYNNILGQTNVIHFHFENSGSQIISSEADLVCGE